MKKIFLTLTLVLAGTLVSNKISAQEVVNGAKIEFNKEVHDYGTIKNGANGSCIFEFKNTGSEALIISNAKGSCGCTVPNWPKEPILPGESGEIEVVFRPSKGQAGSKQTKTVTVSANTSPENTILKITAFVNKTAE